MQQLELTYYHFGDDVVAFSSTRHGGYSIGNYSDFNINPYSGDDTTHIKANRELLCSLLHIPDSRLILPHQTHGIVCRQITQSFLDSPSELRDALLNQVDAVMTNLKNVCVGVSTADCIPVLLYDSHRKAVCAIHAGWRGTLNRIVQHCILEFTRAYSVKVSDIRAVIGPGISLQNFEVGQEVFDQFRLAGFDMSKIAKKYTKWHLDLSECNRIQLIESGLLPDNIHLSGICTYQEVKHYFSARRLGIMSGRIYTALMLR